MSAVSFDTLKFARRLQAADFSTAQAEGFTLALAEAMSDVAVAKAVSRRLEVDLKSGITERRDDAPAQTGSVTEVLFDVRGEIGLLRAHIAKWIVFYMIGNLTGQICAVALVWWISRR